MNILLIAAAFVAVAVTVFLVAMNAGPRRQADPAAGSGGLRFLMVASMLVGFGLSFWVILDNADNQSKDAIGGIALTSKQVEGRELYRQNCSTCHTLADAGAVGRVGPILDDLRPAKDLTVNAVKLGRVRGQGTMPAGLLGGEDAENVADYIAAVAGRGTE